MGRKRTIFFLGEEEMKIRSLLLIVITLFLSSISFGSKNNVIQWEANHLESVLGDVSSETITTSFTSSRELTDVELWVVPELLPYVNIQPQTFDLIVPGVSYEVTITTSIHQGVLPDNLDGTIHVKDDKKTVPATLKLSLEIMYENAVPYPTTKYIHNRTTINLNCELTDDSVLVFNAITDELVSLEPNDVIILGPTQCTPNGFLGFVDDILIQNNVLFVYTSPASLQDAFEKLIIDFSHTYGHEDIVPVALENEGFLLAANADIMSMTASPFLIQKVLYDADGNYGTVNDQVTAEGSLLITPTVDFYCHIDWSWLIFNTKIDEIRFSVNIVEESDLKIDYGVSCDIDKKYKLGEMILGPIPVPGTPVWVTPEIDIYVGVDGSVTGMVSAEVNQSIDVTAGLERVDGSWKKISAFDKSHGYDLDLADSVNCNFRGYIEPEFGLMIYGAVGPTASVQGYLELEAEAALSDVSWKLYGGVDATIGIKSKIFGDLLSYSPPPFRVFREMLASGGGNNTGDILIINPDHHRILKHGIKHHGIGFSEHDCDKYRYFSIAYGQVPDHVSGLTDPTSWTGVGIQPDFIGSILENAGYTVDYLEASQMPSIDASDYAIVIVQDPLRSNLMQFHPSDVEYGDINLLHHVNDPAFNSKLKNYINSGGRTIFVGDAVKMLERDFGKTVIPQKTNNGVSANSCKIPAKWLFIRGNPFCGRNRYGSGAYTISSSSLVPNGTVFSNLSLKNLNDLPTAETWSETIYYPSDGTSLLNVHVSGSGQYVLSGAVCNPPVYSVSVNDTLGHMMGQTTYNGRKIYYIGSDAYFDFVYRNHNGAWHAGEYSEIQNTISETGRNATLKLIEHILD